ncbi:MAG: plastocyanin/azurin family copper-binding protein [Candidatus Brocadiales bacterium]
MAKFPIVVYIDEIPGATFAPKNHPIMDQKNKEFIPRVLPVLVGSTVDFTNQDDMEHNVLSPDNEGYDLGNAGKGAILSYTFKNPGVYAQLCRIHPEMVGYIVVVKTPYFTLTDEQGNFRLENVPPGQHKLKVWGERLKPTQLRKEFFATVEPGKETSVEIKP